MKPDRSTFRVLPWCPTQAAVFVDFYDEEGNPWEFCPRGMVKKAIKNLEEQEGLKLKIGFEVEFAILNL